MDRGPGALAVALVAMTMPSCQTSGNERETLLPVLGVSEPTLQIGVVEGDAQLTFGSVTGVTRLADGSVALADGGSGRISLFGADGEFLRAWGGEGQGPGEFRALARVYPLGADSLMASDGISARVSVFDLNGSLGRELDGVALSSDTTFRLDSWLYARFWVDGALTAAERTEVRRTLDRMPAPRAAPGYRAVRVARDGTLWVREPTTATDGSSQWTSVEADGTPSTVIELPPRFTPHHIDREEVLGVWLDDADVSFVRAYRLVETGTSREAPTWLAANDSIPAVAPLTEEDFRGLMRNAIRALATAQEIHYANHMTYTTELDSLRVEGPLELDISFTHANPRSWAAVFAHPSVDRICGLGYGFETPPGWMPGQVSCAAAAGVASR